MQKDELSLVIGESGPYQRWVIFLLLLPLSLLGFEVMMAIFAFHVPAHRCQVPGLQNDSYAIQDEGHRQLVNRSIPGDEFTEQGYSRCTVYEVSSVNTTRVQHGSFIHELDVEDDATADRNEIACTSWVYETTQFDSTLITQFDLVCERMAFRSHISMAFFAGAMVGGLGSGLLCDWLGRKTVFYFTNVVSLVVGVASAFPPTVEVFMVYRFFLGLTEVSTFNSALVLAMELVGPSKRTMVTSVLTIVWLSGVFLLAAVSYLVRLWYYFPLIRALPLILCLGHWWLLPESPRWLLLKGKTQAAAKVIRKAVKVNKRSPMTSITSLTEQRPDENKEMRAVHILRMLVQSPVLVIRSLIIVFNWVVIGMTYYGLTLHMGSLAGNVRVNFVLTCVMELVAYLAAWDLLERFGRKRSHCAFLFTGGLACLATIFTVAYGGKDLQWATTALAMVGRLGVSAAYSSIYLMSAEIFPTVIRNAGMNISGVGSHLGAMISPYVADLTLFVGGRLGLAVPLVVFGGLATLTGLSAFFLPETLHRKLPDTIADAVLLSRDTSPRGSQSGNTEMALAANNGTSNKKAFLDNEA